MENKEICAKIRAARKNKRLRVAEVAEMLGVSTATLYAMESGHMPKNVSNFIRLSKYLGVNI